MRSRLAVSTVLVVACVLALVTALPAVPVALPYVYSYTTTVTETPKATHVSINYSAQENYADFCIAMWFLGSTINCPGETNGSCCSFYPPELNSTVTTTITWN